jgi:predicted O-methyltransferase YrrM
MQINHTKKSLDIVEHISSEINNKTFHHHYHILYDIAQTYDPSISLNYVEIGCYAGGSACLMLQRPNTNVISIDLGHPISQEIVYSNVTKLNKHNNRYLYLQGNSQLQETVDKLRDEIDAIDILFIDGDHSYNGVTNDFNLYEPLVAPGGFIIFDDYNDHIHSPQVKSAVDTIVTNLNSSYVIIGTLDNLYSARPSELLSGNCFIIKKL